MYRELAQHSRLSTDAEVQEAVFAAVNLGFASISVLPYFLSSIKDFIVDGMDLTVPVDFPYGCSESEVKNHAMINSIRRGCNVIDFVGNTVLSVNGKNVKFLDEVEKAYGMCRDKEVILRVMVEYRLYNYEDLITISGGLKEIGVEYVIPATGEGLDTWDDNLAISVVLQDKTGIKAITNGNIWKKQHMETIVGSKVFGMRLHNLAAIKNIYDLGKPVGEKRNKVGGEGGIIGA